MTEFPAEWFIGPTSGLIIALSGFWVMLKKFESVVTELIASYIKSNEACERRYQQVFDELMKMKDTRQ